MLWLNNAGKESIDSSSADIVSVEFLTPFNMIMCIVTQKKVYRKQYFIKLFDVGPFIQNSTRTSFLKNTFWGKMGWYRHLERKMMSSKRKHRLTKKSFQLIHFQF